MNKGNVSYLLSLIFLLNYTNFVNGQISDVIPNVSAETVGERMQVFTEAFCDSAVYHFYAYKDNKTGKIETGSITFDVYLSTNDLNEDSLNTIWKTWKHYIGWYVTADSTFFYKKISTRFISKTLQFIPINCVYSEKEIRAYKKNNYKAGNFNLSDELRQFVEKSVLIMGSGAVVATQNSIDLTVFSDTTYKSRPGVFKYWGERIMNFITGAYLSTEKNQHYKTNIYFINVASFTKLGKVSNTASNSGVPIASVTRLRHRKLPVIERAFIFAKACMAMTSIQTFGDRNDPDTYINLQLPGDLNIDNTDSLHHWTRLWTHILTDFAAGDSLEIYKGIRYWTIGQFGQMKEFFTKLYLVNPYLVGKEVFDVKTKVELFNGCSWHIRNGLGKLKIRGKKLVLLINCSVHWFKKGNAEVQMKIITDAAAEFIFAYVLRNQLDNYKGIEVYWKNEESNTEMGFAFNWSDPLFRPFLEVEISQ